MRKNFLKIIFSVGILFYLIIPNSAFAWVYEGDVTISNAAGIAALSGCTSVTGNITINSDTLQNLNGLESLASVGGYLSIYHNTALTSLSGLENLTSVGVSLSIYNSGSSCRSVGDLKA